MVLVTLFLVLFGTLFIVLLQLFILEEDVLGKTYPGWIQSVDLFGVTFVRWWSSNRK